MPTPQLTFILLTVVLVAWCLWVPWRVRHMSDTDLAAAYGRACTDAAKSSAVDTEPPAWLPYGLPWEAWEASERAALLGAEVSRRASPRGGRRQLGST